MNKVTWCQARMKYRVPLRQPPFIGNASEVDAALRVVGYNELDVRCMLTAGHPRDHLTSIRDELHWFRV